MIPSHLSLAAFRWIFVATILLSSAQTLVEAGGLTEEPASLPAAFLATIEIAAILAFATERWRRAGAIALVIVFAVAFVASAAAGEFAARFVYFAASAIFLGSGLPRERMEQSSG